MSKLANDQKELPFIHVVQAELIHRGFAVSVPQPDITGEDLWFARERDPRVWRAQAKSAWECHKEGMKQYTFNISFKHFTVALHQPNFVYFFGILNGAENTFHAFDRGCVPAIRLRGHLFRVNAKNRATIVALYIRKDAPSSEATLDDRDTRKSGPTYTLHNGSGVRASKIKGGNITYDHFREDVSEYFANDVDVTDSVKFRVEEDADGRACKLVFHRLAVPARGQGPAKYTREATCQRCKTRFLMTEAVYSVYLRENRVSSPESLVEPILG